MTSTSPPVPQPSLPPPAAAPPAATTLPAASPPSATPPPAAPSPTATPPAAPSPAVTPPPVAAPRPAKTPPSAPPSSSPASSPPPSPESSPPPVPESSPPPAVPSRSPSEPKTPPSPPSKPETPVARSPPAPSGRRLSPPSPPSESKSNGVSATVVVAVVAGAVAAVLLVLILAFLCCRKRRKKDGGVPPPGGYYYRGRENYYGEQWHHQAPLPPDTNAKLPPHFSPPPAYASRPPLPPPPPPPPLFSSSGGSASNNSGSENPLPSPSTGMTLGFAKTAFSFEELKLATDGFSNANLLGQGGFGYVHRGVLPNGKEVAVKQLKTGSGQGETEVEIISRVHHKHLVSLVGYCFTGDKRLLVYEFVPNNTLEFHLHGNGRPTMEWPTRLKIALGAAKGLAYLHEDCHPKIIHRDIKPANILLDYKFEAKISEFGLIKLTSDANTHVSTRVMGTFGYLAPEYATTGKLSDKSDVFSFGVMLLELITGRRPVDTTNTLMDDSLVDWARPLLTRALEDCNYDTIADPRLQKKFNENEMARAIACAAACVRHSARRRPRMTQVVRTLEGDSSLDDLNESMFPGHSSNYGSYGGSDYDSSQYMEDMKKFRKVVLASQEHASSGYSAATSEYGLNPSASSSEAVTREMDISKTRQESGGLR